MSLDIFFGDDLQRILSAVNQAHLDACHQNDCPEVRIYRMGFAAAIRAIATAFGVVVPDIHLGLPQTTLVIPTEVKHERQIDGRTRITRVLETTS